MKFPKISMASHPFLSLLVPYFILCMYVYLNFTYVKHRKNKDLTISGDIKSLNIMYIFVLYIYAPGQQETVFRLYCSDTRRNSLNTGSWSYDSR